MKCLTYAFSLIFIANLSCGVKGPPEPPLPNEANLQKQVLKDSEKAVPPQEPPAAPVVKEKTPTSKKKTKTQ